MSPKARKPPQELRLAENPPTEPTSAPPRSERARGGIRRSGPRPSGAAQTSLLRRRGGAAGPGRAALRRGRLRWTSPRAGGGGGGKRERELPEEGKGREANERKGREGSSSQQSSRKSCDSGACVRVPPGPVLVCGRQKNLATALDSVKIRDRRTGCPPCLADAPVPRGMWTPRMRGTRRGGSATASPQPLFLSRSCGVCGFHLASRDGAWLWPGVCGVSGGEW